MPYLLFYSLFSSSSVTYVWMYFVLYTLLYTDLVREGSWVVRSGLVLLVLWWRAYNVHSHWRVVRLGSVWRWEEGSWWTQPAWRTIAISASSLILVSYVHTSYSRKEYNVCNSSDCVPMPIVHDCSCHFKKYKSSLPLQAILSVCSGGYIKVITYYKWVI